MIIGVKHFREALETLDPANRKRFTNIATKEPAAVEKHLAKHLEKYPGRAQTFLLAFRMIIGVKQDETAAAFSCLLLNILYQIGKKGIGNITGL